MDEINSSTENSIRSLENKSRTAHYLKNGFCVTSTVGSLLSLVVSTVLFFTSDPEPVREYKRGKAIVELIDKPDAYLGEFFTRKKLFDARGALNKDIEDLSCSNCFATELEKNLEYRVRLRNWIYSGLGLTILGFGGASLSRRREAYYETKMNNVVSDSDS